MLASCSYLELVRAPHERDMARCLAFALCRHYLAGVSRRTNPKKPANLRSWRVIIIRSRGELLGYVEALDREREGSAMSCRARRAAS
jgi:hypothetical protein